MNIRKAFLHKAVPAACVLFAAGTIFAADRADFDFQHGVRGLGFVEQFFCDVEVFTQRHCGTVPHV